MELLFLKNFQQCRVDNTLACIITLRARVGEPTKLKCKIIDRKVYAIKLIYSMYI